MTSAVCVLNGFAAYAESAFSSLAQEKSRAKSHFENVLLSARDTLETTLLI